MATPRKRKEKEQFFSDLARLDQSSDDDVDESSHVLLKKPSVLTQQTSTHQERPNAAPSTLTEPLRGARTSNVQRKRKEVAQGKAAHVPALRTANTEPERIRSLSPPVPGAKKAKPAQLRRSKSDFDSTDPLRRKGDRPLKSISEDRRLFEGFTFLFVPCDESRLKDPLYRLRIRLSYQHGAKWVREWTPDVTHIVVYGNLNVSQVAKCFNDGKIPDHTTLVLVDWVVDSIGSRYHPDIASRRYQVEGWIQREVAKVEKSMPSTSVGSHDDTQLDKQDAVQPGLAAKPDREQGSPSECPSSNADQLEGEDVDHNDELQNAIRDVQKIVDVPLVPSFDVNSIKSDEMEDDAELQSSQHSESIQRENKGFQCMEKHEGGANNPNARTIEVLQEMADEYDRTGDPWRPLAYRKGISALRKQSKFIRTKEHALALPQIGSSLAEKIEEIVATDGLKKLNQAKSDPTNQVLRLFMGIYHVGYPTASRWIAQGHRTLEDLYHKADLNRNQRVGIEHYDDFLTRIPRAEVAELAAVVEKVLKTTDNGLQLIIGGSYRRGSKDSGDIDLIITKEDASLEHIRTLMLELVVPELTDQGFLKAALATGGHDDSSSKWHGACALPKSKVWRRIDLLFVPWAELGAALIYFTGNDIFNRSLRLLASRKHMRLNQRGLYADVMRGRGRERVTDGKLLEGQDERRIFEILGVPYRPPHHRCP